MDNHLAVLPSSAIASSWSQGQIELLKTQLIAKGGDDDPGPSDTELAYFFSVCKATGLSPFRKQIYAIRRFDRRTDAYKMALQVSIDGLRAIASRTGQYAGSDDAVFDEGLSTYAMKAAGRKPVTATATVYRLVQGQRCPFSASAAWDEFHDKNSPKWTSMPLHMLGKCAEAMALRKAFPDETSGVELGDGPEDFGGDRSSLSYLNSPGWQKFLDAIERALQSRDCLDKLLQLESWAFKQVRAGRFPRLAENSIERELKAARERWSDRAGVVTAIAIDPEEVDEF